jgi:hypothetical protein
MNDIDALVYGPSDKHFANFWCFWKIGSWMETMQAERGVELLHCSVIVTLFN